MRLLQQYLILALSAINFATARNIPDEDVVPLTIVGGEEATKGEFPFIVGLRKAGRHHCGGSIISPSWIITAAHCARSSASEYNIVAGDHVNDERDWTEQNRTVSLILLHPDYDLLTNDNDIALMRVSRPFEFNRWVQPVALAWPGFDYPAIQTVAGWGRTSENGSPSSVLMKVDVPYVTEDDCRDAYGSRIRESMTCAGEPGKDSCQGDSGGPLICNKGGKQILCGAASWGSGCARPGKPGVYAKIPQFTDWIFSRI